MRALIVGTEATCAALQALLGEAHYSTEVALSGEDGLDIAKRYDFDVVVCELAVPGLRRCELTRRIRGAKVSVPIVIVSEEEKPQYIVEALHAGADDYVLSPYNPDELLARLCAVVRRASGYFRSVITIGDLVVDLEDRTVVVSGDFVYLTCKEWDVFEALVLNRRRYATREYLFERAHMNEEETEIKVIDAFICKIRKKFAQASRGAQYIETVWGRGYRLIEPKPALPIRAAS